MMSKKDTNLGKNIVYMTIYHVFTALTPLIVTPYISRVLGATEIGKYTYAYSLAYYFVMLANLGITTHGSRRIAEVKHNESELNQVFSNLFWLHIIIASIVTIAYILAIWGGINRENRILSLIMTFYVLSSVVDVKWLFYGLENFKVTVIRSIIIKVIYVVLIFTCVRSQNDIATYTFIMAFVNFFLSELTLFIFTFRHIKLLKPVFTGITKDLIPILLLFIPSVANLLLRHFDKIMIGFMSTYEQLGLYENTDRILVILSLLTTSLGDVMLPRVSSLLAKDKADRAKQIFHIVLRFSIVVSCAITFGLIAVAREFVPVFFGKGFDGCVPLLMWIAPSIIMLNLSVSIRKQYLIPNHLEKVYLIATVTSLIVNIIGNAFFIPRYGALGAVYATLMAEMTVILIQFIMVRSKLNYKRYFLDIAIYSIVGIVMYFAVRAISLINGNIFVRLFAEIITGAVIYITLSLLAMKITKDEILLYILGFIKKRRQIIKK